MTVRDSVLNVVLDSVRDLSKAVEGASAIDNLIGGDSFDLVGGDGEILKG